MDDVRERVTRWMREAPRLLELVTGPRDGARNGGAAHGAGRAPRVLVVDDDRELTRVLVEYLGELRGYAVDAAASGEEGLARLAAASFDLVLLDLAMPGLGGMETLARMRAAAPAVPVLVVSASDDASLARRALALGAAGYVAKPFDLDDLDAVCHMHLGARRAGEGADPM